MTPAVPPFPTSWNLRFQPSVGIQTSNLTDGAVTPTTRQMGTGSVPTGAGLAPAGSSSVSVMVVSGMSSADLRSAQATPVLLAAATDAPQHMREIAAPAPRAARDNVTFKAIP